MYDAAVTMAHDFGCAAIGIQYQQGLKDVCVASDLTEGLLNNPDRPPVRGADGKTLFEGLAVPHFNEVDECAGVDALLTNRVWMDLGIDPSTTLHDVRWGAAVEESGVNGFVWVFEISGAAPASHFIGGYEGAQGERQPPMYFPKGGSTLKGISKPGEIVFSRVYVKNHALHMDIGRGGVVKLSNAETERRWLATTPQWPIMHAVTLRDHARPDDGQAHGQPHPGGVRARRDDGEPRARAEGLDGAGPRDPGQSLRRSRADAGPASGGAVPGVRR